LAKNCQWVHISYHISTYCIYCNSVHTKYDMNFPVKNFNFWPRRVVHLFHIPPWFTSLHHGSTWSICRISRTSWRVHPSKHFQPGLRSAFGWPSGSWVNWMWLRMVEVETWIWKIQCYCNDGG
jgi:hypothetical protein